MYIMQNQSDVDSANYKKMLKSLKIRAEIVIDKGEVIRNLKLF